MPEIRLSSVENLETDQRKQLRCIVGGELNGSLPETGAYRFWLALSLALQSDVRGAGAAFEYGLSEDEIHPIRERALKYAKDPTYTGPIADVFAEIDRKIETLQS